MGVRMRITIRDTAQDELGACTRLFLSVVSRPPWNDRWPSFEAARAYLREIMDTPRFRGWAACADDGRMVGYCLGNITRWWQGDEFYVKELGVETGLHRRGIGRRIMAHVERELVAEGCGNLVLLTMRGAPAEAFYEALGFHDVERIMFMAKNIRPSSDPE